MPALITFRHTILSVLFKPRDQDMSDPKLIDSKHNGPFTRDGITVEVYIYRLEDSKWTLEVVDQDTALVG